ncbi:hypothetical protein [Cupriavidus necator]|uniref:hypothetical protein n=1 Tax=Cupriavidus necator TaxID=106590 RepID=UPI0027874AB4|nr:hypothetical protein [Cupriavidus necator]
MPTRLPDSQAVSSAITRSEIFLVTTLADGDDHADTGRAWRAGIAARVHAVGHRRGYLAAARIRVVL